MTFDPRARAAKLAHGICSKHGMYSSIQEILNARSAIESAILAFAREVLTQEPDGNATALGMYAAAEAARSNKVLASQSMSKKVWKAMSAHLAARLEEER